MMVIDNLYTVLWEQNMKYAIPIKHNVLVVHPSNILLEQIQLLVFSFKKSCSKNMCYIFLQSPQGCSKIKHMDIADKNPPTFSPPQCVYYL